MEIVGFSEREADLIKSAAARNLLSPEQKRAILGRVRTASEDLPTGAEGLKGATGGLVTREALEGAGGMAGGMVGGVTGAPAGPGGSAAGGIVGGGIGSAAGAMAFDSVEDLLASAGVIEPPVEKDTSLQANAVRALDAGVEDMAFAGGGMVVGRGLSALGPTLARIIGANTPQARKVMQEAENAGLFITVNGARVPAVGAIDAAPGMRGGALRTWGKVIGGFPFISGPLREQGAKKAGAVIEETNRTLNRLAPTATVSADLGIDMYKAARGSFEEFNRVAAHNYTKFREAAASLKNPDIIPTGRIKEAAQGLMDSLGSGKIDLGIDPKTKKPLSLDRELSGELTRLMDQVSKIPGNITVAQYEAVMDRVGRLFEEKAALSGFEIKELVEFKKAAEEAFLSPDLSKVPLGEAVKIEELHRTATKFFAEGITKFQRSTAQKVARVDRNLFRPGSVKPGSLEGDVLAEAMIKLESPQAIRDLSKLVGKEQMSKLARLKFERSWEGAVVLDDISGEIKGFNWNKIIRDFGFTKEFAKNREAAKALFAETGVPFEQVESLILTASRLEIPKAVNQFLARRAALGGLGSAFGGAMAATIIKDSMIKSMGVGLLMRKFSAVISDPAKLKAMQRIVNDSLPAEQKRAFLGRLIDALGQEDAGTN